MKKVLLLLLLMAPAAHSEPNIFQQFQRCANISVVYTKLATLATLSDEDMKAAYQDYVKAWAARAQTQSEKNLILAIGDVAWAARGGDEPTDAMMLYQSCVKKLGTST